MEEGEEKGDGDYGAWGPRCPPAALLSSVRSPQCAVLELLKKEVRGEDVG